MLVMIERASPVEFGHQNPCTVLTGRSPACNMFSVYSGCNRLQSSTDKREGEGDWARETQNVTYTVRTHGFVRNQQKKVAVGKHTDTVARTKASTCMHAHNKALLKGISDDKYFTGISV